MRAGSCVPTAEVTLCRAGCERSRRDAWRANGSVDGAGRDDLPLPRDMNDDLVEREGLQRLLESSAEVDLVAVYESADALTAAIDDDKPDVVVTDIRMPPHGLDEGIALAEDLRASHPQVGVVVLSNYAEPRH